MEHSYYEAQCCERLNCTCRAMVQGCPRDYPLRYRILDLAPRSLTESTRTGSIDPRHRCRADSSSPSRKCLR